MQPDTHRKGWRRPKAARILNLATNAAGAALYRKRERGRETGADDIARLFGRIRPPRVRGLRIGRGPILLLAFLAVAVLSVQWADRFPDLLRPVVELTSARTLTGPATHVRDGDTIEVSGVAIRLSALDCAELGTEPGEQAAARMRRLVEGQRLTCELSGHTSHDRQVGSCYGADGQSLSGAMIADGTCRRYWGQ